MNNQHHSILGSAVSSSNPRGLPTSQHMYQMQQPNMGQLSHMQQQQQQSSLQQPTHMMNNYSAPKPSDISARQYSPTMSNLNGSAYQSLTGPSLHSNLNMDSSMGFHQPNENSTHHHHQQQQQFNQPQHQYQPPQIPQQPPPQQIHHSPHQHFATSPHNQPPPSPVQPQHHQQQPQSMHQFNQKHLPPHHDMMPSQYNMHQHQQVAPSHQQPPQHSQMKNIPHHQQQQPPSIQQHVQQQQQQQQQQPQPYVHVPQRSYQQPPQSKYERAPQPRRILQNTNNLNRLNQRVIVKDPTPVKEPEPREEHVPETKSVEVVDVVAPALSDDESNPDENNGEKEIENEGTENTGIATENNELANIKEKTPMTLIQELAKFNKIDRKYTLLDEQGPAHKKTFFVKLVLGTEEYQSSGASIRKAQQSAASIALKETKFKHPPVKPAWRAKKTVDVDDGKLTPTVELNGLAMRRGEAAIYKAIEPQQPPYYPPNMDPRAMYSQQRYYHYMRASRDPRYGRGYWPLRYQYPRMNRPFYVSLKVGHREFIGDGLTRQAARHNAAIKALKVIKNLPEKKEEATAKTEKEEKSVEEEEADDDADSLKSHVTQVHEEAFRRKLAVKFEVLRESGAPHMKTFVTRCIVGEMSTDGEGNSKKMSKKLAAERMHEKLKELPPLPPTATKPKPKTQVYKKRSKIKTEIQQQKADPNYGVGVNPISRLIQIMCAQKKKEPVYSLLAERGISCRKEFIIQIEVDGKKCNGSGPNKKLAKRAAAEAMLDLLGYNKPTPQPAKSSIKQPTMEGNGTANGEKKVTFSENVQKALLDVKSVNGQQQKVPGLLHLPPKTVVSSPVTTSTSKASMIVKEPLVNLSHILKPNWRPELRLRELCKALNYPLEINDFTKNQANNALEYISRITVGPSDQQQNFIGTSSSLESARDMACMEALKVLVSRAKDMHAAGDGSLVKKSVLSRS